MTVRVFPHLRVITKHQVKSFKEFHERFQSGDGLGISFHRNADLDALTSSYALKSLYFPNANLYFVDRLDPGARRFVDKAGVAIRPIEEAEELLIVLDTSTRILFPYEENKDKIIGVIDHHYETENTFFPRKDGFSIYVPKAHAVAEIVYQLYKFYPVKELPREVAYSLLVGIISDTNKFSSFDSLVWNYVGELLSVFPPNEREKVYERALADAFPVLDEEEAEIVKEGIGSALLTNIGGYRVAFSYAKDFVGIVASKIIDSQLAQVSFVGKWDEKAKSVRISARASPDFPISLKDVMNEVGRRANGGGGGHDKAAGALCKPSKEGKEGVWEALSVVERVMKEFVEKYE